MQTAIGLVIIFVFVCGLGVIAYAAYRYPLIAGAAVTVTALAFFIRGVLH